MKKLFRLIGIALVAVIGFVLVCGIALQLIFGSSLKALVVRSINEQLDAPLLIKGDVDFSVFRSFPYMSVDFNDVELKEGIKGSDKSLLTAQRVSMQFNVMSVIYGNYTIRRIKIRNGRLSTSLDQHGDANYFVFKKSTGGVDSTAVSIEEIILDNVDIVHNDIYNRQSYSLNIKSGKASGNFSASKFKTDVLADVLINDANVQGTKFLVDKTATLDLSLDVDIENEVYKFERCRLAVSEAAFVMKGNMSHSAKGYAVDLFFNGEDVGLEELGSLLPTEYYKPIQALETRGELTCTGNIKGMLSKKLNPAVEFRFGVKNGTIKHKDSGESIDNVNFVAVYNNGTTHTWNGSKVIVNDATLSFNDQPFQCSFDLTRFDRPLLNLNVNGLVDLASLKPFLGFDDDVELKGEMQLINFVYHGAAQALGSRNVAATQSEGMLVFKDVSYNGNGLDIKSLNSTMVSNGNSLRVQQGNALVGETDLAMSGEIQNMIPALLNGFKNTPLHFDMSLHAEHFNTSDFTFKSSSTDTATSDSENSLLNNISGRVVCSALNFKYDDFTARNVETNLSASNGVIRFNALRFDALQGTTKANGTMDLRQPNVQVLETTFTCNNVNINQLFKEFNDFSQTEFTADNIEGTLNTTCYVKAVWKNGEFQTNDLVALADVTIDKGELNDFKPMYALSKFAKVDDLNNIRFSRLSNQIEIRKSVIHIPTTVIRSNVMTVELAGTHTIDNYIDYRLKLNLSEMVGKKFRKASTFDPDATEAGINGTFNLYVTMKGPASNPTITYDKRAVKQAVQENLAQEKKDLKEVLRQEFTRQEVKEKPIKEWQEPEEYELIDFDANADDQSK